MYAEVSRVRTTCNSRDQASHWSQNRFSKFRRTAFISELALLDDDDDDDDDDSVLLVGREEPEDTPYWKGEAATAAGFLKAAASSAVTGYRAQSLRFKSSRVVYNSPNLNRFNACLNALNSPARWFPVNACMRTAAALLENTAPQHARCCLIGGSLELATGGSCMGSPLHTNCASPPKLLELRASPMATIAAPSTKVLRVPISSMITVLAALISARARGRDAAALPSARISKELETPTPLKLCKVRPPAGSRTRAADFVAAVTATACGFPSWSQRRSVMMARDTCDLPEPAPPMIRTW